jgi:GMP synthase-like glutamine amidotransferase
VQHAIHEPSCEIGAALGRAGMDVDVRRVDAGEPLPSDPSPYDALVVMGGPMSATSDAGFATRRAEVALLRDAVEQDLPTLGVCLGAQLLALAAGGRVFPGAAGPEIGWSAVELLPAREDDPLFRGFPDRMPVLHWHSDTFDLPPGARRLAGSERYANQAFRVGRLAWGLQFHLEVTSEAVDRFVAAFPADAARAPGGAGAIRSATPAALGDLHTWRDLALDRFAALATRRWPALVEGGSPHGFADISEP